MAVYLVKDTDGEHITVRADDWISGGDGLKFFVKGERVAHFLRWVYFKKFIPTTDE
jgi:hypothetical protein